jgi:hypothetical protein
VGTLRDRHALSLTVVPTGGNGFSLTTYSLEAPQKPGSDRIKANLGKLGRIDVRFVAESSHHEKAPLPSCEGDKPRMEKGRFVGQIHFHGEDGYTRVDVHHAGGQVSIQPKQRCNVGAAEAELDKLVEELAEEIDKEEKKEKGSEEPEGPEPEVHLVKLKAKTEANGRQVAFDASRLSSRVPGKKGTSFASFSVKAERHRGRIDETSSASLIFEPGAAFKVPDLTHLTSEAVVKPPRPFLGSATFRRESADRVTWKGDLKVALPGLGVVPLAGPKFTTTICADSGCY